MATLVEAIRLLRAEADPVVVRRLALALLLVVCGGLLAGLSPLALKALVDALAARAHPADGTPPSAVLVPGILYLLAVCTGRLITELRPRIAGSAEQRLYARLRRRFFAHLLDLPLACHLRRRTGALLHDIQQAIAGCQLLVTHAVGSIVPIVVEVATATVALAHLHQPALAATFAMAAGAYLTLFWRGAARLGERSHAVARAGQDAHALLADGLLNCETIKCFGAEPVLRERHARATAELETSWSRLHGARARQGLAVVLVFACALCASLFLSLRAVAAGTLSVGGFVLATMYMLQVIRPLELLGSALHDVVQALAMLRPMLDLLAEPTEPLRRPQAETDLDHAAAPRVPDCVPAGAPQRGPSPPSIRFEGIRFAYDAGRPVLDGLDLHIPAGRTLAIVGASGCGKSSLARLLLRLHEPQAGRILLDPVPIDAMPLDELRRAVGFVPQDIGLLDDTLAANIALGRLCTDPSELERAARCAQLQDFIASLPEGYDTRVGERGLKLSGGERQRVAIARAVFKRPRILVLDEATSMLDGRTEAAILRELRVLCAGCTTITIAHRLSTVRQADEIAVLENGRIVERGPHAALLSAGGAYARLWHEQRAGVAARCRVVPRDAA